MLGGMLGLKFVYNVPAFVCLSLESQIVLKARADLARALGKGIGKKF